MVLGVHAQAIKTLTQQLADLEAQVREITLLVAKLRGAWGMLLVLTGAAGGLAGFVAWVVLEFAT